MHKLNLDSNLVGRKKSSAQPEHSNAHDKHAVAMIEGNCIV